MIPDNRPTSGRMASSFAAMISTPVPGTAQPVQPRATRRRGSSATSGHVRRAYPACVVRPSDSEEDKAKGAVPCYIVGLSVDPASFHPGIAARKAVEDALAIAPGLEEVLTDMRNLPTAGRLSSDPCTSWGWMSSGT